MADPLRSSPAIPDRPRRSPDVVECRIKDELVVYVRGTATAVALNATALAVWELCEGHRSVGEIARALGQRFDLPGDALVPDIHEALARFAALGLLHAAGS
jgi:hypothetical protein